MIMIMMFDDNGMKLVLLNLLYYFSSIRRFYLVYFPCRGALVRATVKIPTATLRFSVK